MSGEAEPEPAIRTDDDDPRTVVKLIRLILAELQEANQRLSNMEDLLDAAAKREIGC